MAGRLLLVGWEAADWNLLHPLVDDGEMPALRRLVEEGSSGPLSSVQPLDTASEWTSISTGKRAWQHHVCLSVQPAEMRFEATDAASRHALAVWEILSARGKRSVVVGWPATHRGRLPVGALVSDRFSCPTAPPGKPWPPAPDGTYWPREIGVRLDPLRISPEEIDSDTIAAYIPDWQKIDQRRDPRLSQLRLLLAADFSHQAAITELMATESWDFATVRFRSIGEICRIFMPFHNGDFSEHGMEAEAAIYGDVIRSSYRMLDLMLQRLVDLAGPETTVVLVSSHGTLPSGRHGPPSLALDADSWKHPCGLIAARGECFSRDTLLHGANALDVTPTLLAWFGLPVGKDMEGTALGEGFAGRPAIQFLESWENDGHGKDAAADVPPDIVPSPWQQARDWNFTRACLDAGRPEIALPVLERLFREFPEQAKFSHTLFQCQLVLGRLDQAEQTLEIVLESTPPGMLSLLPQAELAYAKGDAETARKLVSALQRWAGRDASAWRRIGILLLRLRDWDALENCARRLIEQDEHDEIAWLGLAEALLRKGRPKKAAAAAMRAIGLKFFLPDAHFLLARALAAEEMWLAAMEALERLLRIDPANAAAAAYLGRMQRMLGRAA